MMNTVLVKPSCLAGEIWAIPSKSQAHRQLICAALADSPSQMPPAHGEDIAATIGCLRALGADISLSEQGFTINPLKKVLPSPLLDCGESGSTLRFLLPVSGVLAAQASFSGKGRLPARPLKALMACLQEHGLSFSAESLPFTLKGHLAGGLFELPGHISSQYLSGLLLALPLAEKDSEIRLTSPLQSRGYAEMTLDVLRRFSIKVEQQGQSYRIAGGQTYHSPGRLLIEGDWSNAAFFLAAGALAGPLCLRGLNPCSAQPDRELLNLLEGFGAHIKRGEDWVSVEKGQLYGQDIDISETPDLAPVVAVLGALAQGTTRLQQAARLRYKESDRLNSIAALLSALGARVCAGPDSLTIFGQPLLRGGRVKSHGDHRIVMAAALAALACEADVEISAAQALNKSYPHFFADYRALGGKAYDVYLG